MVNRRVQRAHEDALLFYVGELGAAYVQDLATLFFGAHYPGAPWELFEARFPAPPLHLSLSAVHRLCRRLAADGRLSLTAIAQPVGRPRVAVRLGEEALLRSRRLRSRRHLLASAEGPEALQLALLRAQLRALALADVRSPRGGVGRDGVALLYLRKALSEPPFSIDAATLESALPAPAVGFLDGARGVIRELYRCDGCGYLGAFRQLHVTDGDGYCEGALRAWLPLPIDVVYGLGGSQSVRLLMVDDGLAPVASLFAGLEWTAGARRPVELVVAARGESESLPAREQALGREAAIEQAARRQTGLAVRFWALSSCTPSNRKITRKRR